MTTPRTVLFTGGAGFIGMHVMPLLLERGYKVRLFDSMTHRANRDEIDALIAARLSKGWSLERLDKPMRQILRAGAYELIARTDVPKATVISEYVDVAHAFYERREAGFVNGLLDGVSKDVRK